MKNYIRTLPCLPVSPSEKIRKQKSKLEFSMPNSPNNYIPFEFATFTNLKQSPRRPSISASPRNNIKILNTVIGELREIKTADLRKNINITEKDLKNRVNDLKVLTRLDFDEHIDLKLKRWSQRRFIKVEEREIRRIIKRDTKNMINFL